MKEMPKFKPLLVVSATAGDGKKTRLESCKQSLKDQANFKIVTNNTNGLPKVYNTALTKKNEQKHDIAVFVHDDVYIDDLKLRGKLYKSMFVDDYDIVGIAGASTCKIQHPALWHLMSDRESWSGCVYHPSGGTESMQIIATNFGPVPKRCVLLDGVFLAVNIAKVRKAKWRFNDNYKFHHYDIASCIDANNKQLKLGTAPIHIIHDSPGLRSIEDEEWSNSEQQFLKEYSKHD